MLHHDWSVHPRACVQEVDNLVSFLLITVWCVHSPSLGGSLIASRQDAKWDLEFQSERLTCAFAEHETYARLRGRWCV